jgi:hypothetical protein
MNQDQIMVIVRTVLQTFGPLLVARGVIPSDSLNGFESAIIAVVGAALTLGSMIWGIWVQSHTSKIAAVNAIAGVKVVPETAPGPTVTTAPKP